MAKLTRESRLRERRLEKEARKRARKDAATHPPGEPEGATPEGHVEVDPGADDTLS